MKKSNFGRQMDIQMDLSHSGLLDSAEDILLSKPTPWYKKQINGTVKVFPLCLAFLTFIIVISIPMFDRPEAHRCAALLSAVAILWGTSAIPVVATALFIPLPVVVMGILLDDDLKPVSATDAANLICWQYFDPIVLLFLGGFTIAKAMEKYGISAEIARRTLSRAGSNPSHILFSIMFLGMFLSMWISNVAASVLCVSASIPILHQLPRNHPYCKALVLGIAFSCNIGGMTTPIASPQNAIALYALKNVEVDGHKETCFVSFVEWMAVAMPVCIVLLVVGWRFLLWMYPVGNLSINMKHSVDKINQDDMVQHRTSVSGIPGVSGTQENPPNTNQIKSLYSDLPEPDNEGSDSINYRTDETTRLLHRSSNDFESLSVAEPEGTEHVFEWTPARIYVIVITLITVLLWCTESLHIQYTGNIGIIAVIPVVFFFGSNILTVQEFDSLSWSVLLLMGGGLALGYAIQASQLLDITAMSLSNLVSHSSPWVILLAFSSLMGIMANFISSTVAAVIILPVMAVVGAEHHHMRMLVINSALMCSGAMALPVSSFPNANSFSIVDSTKKPYAPTSEYIRAGLPMTLFSVIGCLTLGFAVSLGLGY